jgi:hypothetical protein
MRLVHTAEGSANIVQRRTDQTRKRGDDWRLARAHDFVVNEKTEGGILEHGGNVTGEANGSQARRTLRIRRRLAVHKSAQRIIPPQWQLGTLHRPAHEFRLAHMRSKCGHDA